MRSFRDDKPTNPQSNCAETRDVEAENMIQALQSSGQHRGHCSFFLADELLEKKKTAQDPNREEIERRITKRQDVSEPFVSSNGRIKV